ncbi:MAG: hypothetical protein Q8M76_07755, partial [Spirochaetaceae bacterium]|nr:hypothetical protein [Spirochaetaceae bacterium]
NPTMVMNGDQPEFTWNDENQGNTLYNTTDSAATRRTGFRLTRPAGYATATVNSVLQRFIVTGLDSTYPANNDNIGYLEVTGFNNQVNDGATDTYSPSSNGGAIAGQARWAVVQGNAYTSPLFYPPIANSEDYKKVNRFPHPKLLAEGSNLGGNWGANLWLTYFDTAPGHRMLNFLSFRMTGSGAANNNLNLARYGTDKSPDIIEIPGTTGNSSEYFDMVRVGANGIAVAYYDETAKVLKLKSSTDAFRVTGVVATENKTKINQRETSTITVVNGTKANWVGDFFTFRTDATSYDVWYDTTGIATKPGAATAPNNIKVVISAVPAGTNTAATRDQIKTATVNAINAAAVPGISLGTGRTDIILLHVLAYTDVTNISSNFNGGNDATVATTVNGDGTIGTATWATLTVDSSGDVGQHVSLVADATGTKLYLAYYDFDNANLKFARVSWNAGAPTVDEVVNIDNYLSAGTWTNIQLMTNSSLTTQGSDQPVIAYYADSYNGTKKPVRLAFPKFNATTGSLLAGTTNSGADEEYSGDWEVITVPALTVPKGGAETFNGVQAGLYSSNTLPVLGWLGTKIEYGKLLPNN